MMQVYFPILNAIFENYNFQFLNYLAKKETGLVMQKTEDSYVLFVNATIDFSENLFLVKYCHTSDFRKCKRH